MSFRSNAKFWIPWLFVLFWSTGFIGAKYGLPYIEPFYFLFIRMLITLVLLLGLIVYFKAQWPNWSQARVQMLVGFLIHATYLGGVFTAIDHGMSAGIAAIIVGLQPILTALIAWGMNNQGLRIRQWLGLVVGFIGLILVVLPKVSSGSELNTVALIAIILALVGISSGTLIQKARGSQEHLLTGAWYQYLMTGIATGVASFFFEEQTVEWAMPLIFAMAWLVIVLSVCAILLLMLMIRDGESAKVASYFYLVPPLTALEGWLLFNEQLGWLGLLGMVLAALGVYWVIRTPQTSSTLN